MIDVLVYALIGILSLFLIWFLIEKRRRRTHPVKGGIDPSISLPHTEPIELYSNSFSHSSRKCRLVLAELGTALRSPSASAPVSVGEWPGLVTTSSAP